MRRIQFDLTSECNADCEFCYSKQINDSNDSNNASKDTKNNNNPPVNQLSLEFIEKQISSEPNSTVINIGGGEPFLHKDLENILNIIVSKGHQVVLSTNATNIPSWFYNIDRQKIVTQVSLHASTREKYQEITGINAFDDVLANISMLKDVYRTIVNSCIYKKNLTDVPGIINICSKLDVPLNITLAMPVGKGKNVDLLDKEDISHLSDLLMPHVILRRVYSTIIQPKTDCNLIAKYYGYENDGIKNCKGYDGSFVYVNPDGAVQNCLFSDGGCKNGKPK